MGKKRELKNNLRASHYYTNVESGLVIVKEPKQVLNLEKYEVPLPKKNPLEFLLKDNVVEIPPSTEILRKWRILIM